MADVLRILVKRSSIVLLEYNRYGIARSLERDLSVFDPISHEYTHMGYIYNRAENTLSIPSTYGLARILDRLERDGIIVKTIMEHDEEYPKPRIIDENKLKLTVKPRNRIQQETVNFLVNNDKKSIDKTNIRRQVSLATGFGKTICLIMAAKKLRVPVIVFSVNLSHQWIEKIILSTGAVGGEDLMIIKNYDSLKRLVSSRKKPQASYYVMGLDAGVASLKKDPEILQKLIEKEGIGMAVFDEAHEHFLKIIKITLSIDIEKIVDLTATPDRSTYQQNRLYQAIFSTNVPSYGAHTGEMQKFNIIMLDYKTNPTYEEKDKCQTIRGFSSNIYYSFFFNKKSNILMMQNIIRHFIGTVFGKNGGNLDEKILIYIQSRRGIKVLKSMLEKYPVIDDLKITYGDYTMNTTGVHDRKVQLMRNVIFTTIAKRNGLDLENLTLVMNFVPYSHTSISRQMRGRLRDRVGKEDYFVDAYDSAYPGMLRQKDVRISSHRRVAKTLSFYKSDDEGIVERKK